MQDAGPPPRLEAEIPDGLDHFLLLVPRKKVVKRQSHQLVAYLFRDREFPPPSTIPPPHFRKVQWKVMEYRVDAPFTKV